MSDRPPKNHHHHLLVEGINDRMVTGELLARHGIVWPETQWQPFINATGGIDELLKTIPVACRASYHRLGVVVDADLSGVDRWRQVTAKFASGGINLPATPEADGTIVDLETPGQLRRVGVWMMPDNAQPGAIEDFIQHLVHQDDPIWPIAGTSTLDAQAAGAPVKQAIKGQVHAYLAWQEPPGLPFGSAIKAQVFRHNAALATRFVDWLRRLFDG